MLVKGADETDASAPVTLDNRLNDSVTDAGSLNLEIDFDIMSVDHRQQLEPQSPASSKANPQQDSSLLNAMTDVDDEVSRQDTNHNGLARFGRDSQSFDVAPVPRLIRAHRRRRSRYPVPNSSYRRSDHYTPDYAKYIDCDAVRTQRAQHSSSRRNASPGTFEPTLAVASVAPMADNDAREERDNDRRGTDSYRGGGNKRRRDGKLAALRRLYHNSLPHTQMTMALPTEMIAAALRDAAEMILLAAATKNHPSLSCDA